MSAQLVTQTFQFDHSDMPTANPGGPRERPALEKGVQFKQHEMVRLSPESEPVVREFTFQVVAILVVTFDGSDIILVTMDVLKWLS